MFTGMGATTFTAKCAENVKPVDANAMVNIKLIPHSKLDFARL